MVGGWLFVVCWLFVGCCLLVLGVGLQTNVVRSRLKLSHDVGDGCGASNKSGEKKNLRFK